MPTTKTGLVLYYAIVCMTGLPGQSGSIFLRNCTSTWAYQALYLRSYNGQRAWIKAERDNTLTQKSACLT
jgi:hypothetical protein